MVTVKKQQLTRDTHSGFHSNATRKNATAICFSSNSASELFPAAFYGDNLQLSFGSVDVWLVNWFLSLGSNLDNIVWTRPLFTQESSRMLHRDLSRIYQSMTVLTNILYRD